MSKELVNSIKRNPLSNGIVLHDFEVFEDNFREFFSSCIKFFEEHGITPTKMDITGPNGIKGNKNITAKNGIKKLEACNFKGIDGLWMGATPPNHGDDSFDSIFTVQLRLTPGKGTFALCFDSEIISFERDMIVSLFKRFEPFFKAQYGYGFQRIFGWGPSYYAFGTIGSGTRKDPPKEEKDRITSWGIEYGCSDGDYKTGDFREIYPYNLVCKKHLEHKIEEKTLQQWIEQDSCNGDLEPIGEDRWLWIVPEDQIQRITDALAPTGIIICVSKE